MPAYLIPVAALIVSGLPAGTAGALELDRAPARFLVTLEDRVDARAVAREYRERGAVIDHVYTTVLQGFAGSMSDAAVAGLLRDGRVRRVERDGVARATTTQTYPAWGLDRTDQRNRPLDRSYSYGTTGQAVHAYVIDTGIRQTHTEFTGRIGNGYDAVAAGGTAEDCHGHGTHVAGTVGGALYGVAKQVTLHPVRVLGCTGSGAWSGVIAGIDWVARNHATPAVANLSLGGGANLTVDDAVRRLVASGVATTVAAGNSGLDACTSSPARVPEAVTVGATDNTDTKASFSNFGACLDLFAPGVGIPSAAHTSNTASTLMSGTSMASPHVAGVMARYLQAHPAATPGEVAAAVISASTLGVVSSPGIGSPNKLLFMAAEAASVPQPVTEPAPSPSPSPSPTPSPQPVTSPSPSPAPTASPTPTAAPAPPASIELSARTYKVKGAHRVDLTFRGATSEQVDVFRNTTRIATTANDGAYTDALTIKGSASYTYMVCEAATTTCSSLVRVSF